MKQIEGTEIWYGFVYGTKENGEFVLMPVRTNENLQQFESINLMHTMKMQYTFPIHISKAQANSTACSDVVATISSNSCGIIYRGINDKKILDSIKQSAAAGVTTENFSDARSGNLGVTQKYTSFECMRAESVKNRFPSRRRNNRKRSQSNKRNGGKGKYKGDNKNKKPQNQQPQGKSQKKGEYKPNRRNNDRNDSRGRNHRKNRNN